MSVFNRVLAPLLFLSIAQFTVATNKWNKPHQEAAEKPAVPAMKAGIFAALYLVGRILEHRLVKALFRKRLLAV